MARFIAFKPAVDEPKKKGRLKGLGKVMTRAKNVILNVLSPKRAQKTQNRRTRDLFHPSIHRRLSFKFYGSGTDSSCSVDSLLCESYTCTRKRKVESHSDSSNTPISSKPSPSSSNINSNGDIGLRSSDVCSPTPSRQVDGPCRSLYLPVLDHPNPTDFRSETALHEVQMTPFLMDSPAKPAPPKKRRRLFSDLGEAYGKVRNNEGLDDTIHNIPSTMPNRSSALKCHVFNNVI